MQIGVNLYFNFCIGPDINSAHNLEKILYYWGRQWGMGVNFLDWGVDPNHTRSIGDDSGNGGVSSNEYSVNLYALFWGFIDNTSRIFYSIRIVCWGCSIQSLLSVKCNRHYLSPLRIIINQLLGPLGRSSYYIKTWSVNVFTVLISIQVLVSQS